MAQTSKDFKKSYIARNEFESHVGLINNDPQAATVSGHRAGKAVTLLGTTAMFNEGEGNGENLHQHCVHRKPHFFMKTSTYIVTGRIWPDCWAEGSRDLQGGRRACLLQSKEGP